MAQTQNQAVAERAAGAAGAGLATEQGMAVVFLNASYDTTEPVATSELRPEEVA
jgi:hypothetical protein